MKILTFTLIIVLLGTVLFAKTPLEFKLISIEEMGEYVFVKVKIKNISEKHINRARVACILLDANKNEITFEEHYVIKATEGGLHSGGETYFNYSIRAPYSEIKFVRWHILSIDFK